MTQTAGSRANRKSPLLQGCRPGILLAPSHTGDKLCCLVRAPLCPRPTREHPGFCFFRRKWTPRKPASTTNDARKRRRPGDSRRRACLRDARGSGRGSWRVWRRASWFRIRSKVALRVDRSLAAGQLDCLWVSCPYMTRLTDSFACLAYAVAREWVSFELSEAVQQQRSAQAIDDEQPVNRASPTVHDQGDWRECETVIISLMALAFASEAWL